jgi:hypothetical protein
MDLHTLHPEFVCTEHLPRERSKQGRLIDRTGYSAPSTETERERAAAAHTLEEADVSVEGGLEGDVGRGGGHGCSGGGGGGSSRFYSSWEGFVGSGRGGDGVSGAKRVQTGATLRACLIAGSDSENRLFVRHLGSVHLSRKHLLSQAEVRSLNRAFYLSPAAFAPQVRAPLPPIPAQPLSSLSFLTIFSLSSFPKPSSQSPNATPLTINGHPDRTAC